VTRLWQILIATIPHRHEKLCALLAELGRQQEELFGPGESPVGVLLFRDNLELSYGEKNQVLVTSATAEYVSCFDDDDWPAPGFLAWIWQALASRPDYVGFRVLWTRNGTPQLPVIHSLACTGWHEAPDHLYRDITQFNPIRRELALTGTWAGGGPSPDRDWAGGVRASGRCKVQAWVPEALYRYRENTADTYDTARQPLPLPLPPLPSYPWLTEVRLCAT
jgi:hypothetical protein